MTSAPPGIAGVFDRAADTYDTVGVPWFGPVAQGLVEELDVQPGERVLDLATGTGWTSRIVARRGAQVIGADISAELLAFASEQAKAEGLNITYQLSDAEKLPFADGTFDAVVTSEVLEHIPNDSGALAELSRVLKPGSAVQSCSG